MESGIRIHSYLWKYKVTFREDEVLINCYRHSGPVSKYHFFARPQTLLINNSIQSIVEAELGRYAEKHGA